LLKDFQESILSRAESAAGWAANLMTVLAAAKRSASNCYLSIKASDCYVSEMTS
jgi:hypothetical protein